MSEQKRKPDSILRTVVAVAWRLMWATVIVLVGNWIEKAFTKDIFIDASVRSLQRAAPNQLCALLLFASWGMATLLEKLWTVPKWLMRMIVLIAITCTGGALQATVTLTADSYSRVGASFGVQPTGSSVTNWVNMAQGAVQPSVNRHFLLAGGFKITWASRGESGVLATNFYSLTVTNDTGSYRSVLVDNTPESVNFGTNSFRVVNEQDLDVQTEFVTGTLWQQMAYGFLVAGCWYGVGLAFNVVRGGFKAGGFNDVTE